MRYKAAAKKLRQIVGLSDPIPAATILAEDDKPTTAGNSTPDVKIVQARAIWLEVAEGIAANTTSLIARIDDLVDPVRIEDANMLAGWMERYSNKITVRTKYAWWRKMLERRRTG